jgi:hypothetical protein
LANARDAIAAAAPALIWPEAEILRLLMVAEPRIKNIELPLVQLAVPLQIMPTAPS